MKYIIYISLFVSLSISALAGTKIKANIMCEGVMREFIVSVPLGKAPVNGYPIVIMFHGTSGDGEKFYNMSGWKEKGDKENFVTVFPSSLEYCFYNWETGDPNKTSKWNCGDAEEDKCEGEVIDKNDVLFMRKMLDTIINTLPIDRTRIYASGFSNGGGFAGKLAIEMSDVFAAIGCSSGALNTLDSAAPKRYIPVVFSIGSMDNRITTKAGITEIPFNDSCQYYLGGILLRYLGALNLTQNYTKDSTALSLTYTFTEPNTSIVSGSKNNGILATERFFSFTLLKGLSHEYPNGENYPVAAADGLWQIFKQYTLTLSPVDEPEINNSSLIYPNPAESYIFINGEGEMTLSLYSLLGQQVFTVNSKKGIKINLPKLMTGIYFSEIISNGKTVVDRLVIH